MWLFDFKRRSRLRSAKNGAHKLLLAPVRERMSDYVVTISPQKSVADAAAIMVGEDISALVVEQDGKPIGVLTERDFISRIKKGEQRVADVMSGTGEGRCLTVAPAMTLAQAHALMREHKVRKLVVLDDVGLIAGIITQSDLSRAIYECVGVVPPVASAPYLVRDVMAKRIVSVAAESPLTAAKQLMGKSNVSAIPVTQRKEYVGIITEYDIVSEFYDAHTSRTVAELMKGPLKGIPAGLSIFDANTIMLFEKIRRLLVIDEGKVVGIVTQTDLVHACFDYAERMERFLQEQGATLRAEDFILLKRREAITSQYAGEHLRAYTMREK